VTISLAELESLRAAAGGSRARGGRPAPDGPDAATARELAARERRIAELESVCKSAVRDRELATALAGRTLAAGAAGQLVKLWRDEFDVFEQDGSYRVASRDGRSVSQAVGDWLASSEYAHFTLASSRGGSGARDANRPAAPGPGVTLPKNLGEAVVMKWREESVTRPDSLLKPIGLRRNR